MKGKLIMTLGKEELFDFTHTIAGEMLMRYEKSYEAIAKIEEICFKISQVLDSSYTEIQKNVFVAKDAQIESGTLIYGPAIIGSGTVIRHGAYIRGNVIIGKNAVIGNSTEIKNSVIFDDVQLPHYNYVGDSIIGYKAHLGAGVIISNLRLDRKEVTVRDGNEKIYTGLRKMGALIGDSVEIGCNCVICPGSIIERGCLIYPLSQVSGILRSQKREERN